MATLGNCAIMTELQQKLPSAEITQPTHPKKREVSCEDCGLSGFLTFITYLEQHFTDQKNISLQRQQPMAAGEILFRAGTPAHAFYAVKSGAIKTYTTLSEETEQITGFYLPGEVLGLASIHTSIHDCTARVMEPTHVCEIQFATDQSSKPFDSMLQEHLVRLMARQLSQAREQFILASRPTAETRMAAFLLDLSKRLAGLGFHGDAFRLPMSRLDIADYLGLAMETVSRTLQNFQNQGLISVSGKQLKLLRRQEMEGVAYT